MNLIYIQLPDGQQAEFEDEQVYEMLAQEALSPEFLFWREGMTEWRPLAELQPPEEDWEEPPQEENTVAPPRRKVRRTPNFKTPTKSFQSGEKRAAMPVFPPEQTPKAVTRSEEDGGHWKRKAAGRFYFRVNPVPLTVGLQLLTVLAISGALFLIYQCLDKIFGWSNTDAMLAASSVLGEKVASNANPTGISLTDISFSNQFLCLLTGLQLLVEILFYLWVYYANKNSRGFSNNILFTSAWAVAYFFIPVVNLFRPYQVMQEIWKVSEDPRSWLGRRDSIFVGVWFVLRVSILVLSNRWLYNSSELGYLAMVESDIVLIEASTFILISLVIWRQVKWVRKGQ